MKNNRIKHITECGVISAIYVVLTLLSSLFGLSSGAIQFRLSESLCFLPAFIPYSTIGLTLGCILSNLTSPLGIIDIFFGSAGTLISCLLISLTKKFNKNGFPLLFPVINGLVNSLIIGLEFIFIYNTDAKAFIITFFEIFTGITAVGYTVGFPLFKILKNTKIINIKSEGEHNEKNHSSR